MKPMAQSVYTPGPGEVDRYARQVGAQAIDYLYRGLPRVSGTIFMPIVMTWVMWQRIDHAILMAWCVAMFLVSTATQLLATAYLRRAPAMQEAPRWGRYFSMVIFANGLTWGVAGILFFVADSAALQVFLLTSIIGLCAGSISLLSYWLESYYAFIVPPLSLSAVRLFLEGGIEYQGLAVLVLMSMVVLLLVGHSVRKSVMATIHLRFENLDLVKQLRAEKEKADAANRDKTRFLASASHDLRQPLHALRLYATALSNSITFSGEPALVKGINRSVGALESLFNALLDISKLDAGVIQPQRQDVHAGRLLQRLAAEYAPQAQAKGLVYHGTDTDLAVRTDPALLETILRNLISNAIRYTVRGGIRTECSSEGRQVHIDVIDTGIGIPLPYQQEIFQEFVQLQNPERDRSKGLGLGLAIVKRLSMLLGHDIQVHSTPEAGSRFRLSMPTGEQGVARAMEDEDHRRVDRLVSGTGRRILVIDDEADIRGGTEALLTGWGYEVMTAGTVTQALALLSERQGVPDLAIVDFRLQGGVTGIEAIHQIRKACRADMPALIVSGDIAPEHQRAAEMSGLVFLHKPVPLARLRAFLRNTLHAAE
jgi:signal transduction histidine kinase/ActR/RegA family two-component response regulator